MNSRQPPALAVWLLNRLGLAKRNEPLTGDLLEEFRNDRTVAWYWRQTFMAIAAAFGQRLRFYRFDLLSLFVGWTAETGVLLAWWILRLPFGLYGFLLEVSTLAAVWMVMYIEYRIRLQAWRNDLDSSDEESHDILERRIGPRFMALVTFGIAVVFDGATMLATRLPWPAHLALLPTLLILNIVMFFAFSMVRVLRSPDSSGGDDREEESPGFWRREISGLGTLVFLCAVALLCRDDRDLARLPWLEPTCWSSLSFLLSLSILRLFYFAGARILRSHADSSVATQPPGGDA
jgi:hypothetical protein